ncbi:hypothetical protein AMAG_09276 [Allomyces macrogynus ATCC 38327]|uniref:tRNA ligase n=1 Tax=Allomyces macrogynus (strain ATCC 38327) TaxID=578462 RepID=A0A0L0SPB9_ALLM3|nr:hypothetical protein AMAG_09276 [Allomyces macrogynus ATCC 38327]|eukprot:KNE64239.1 hypothetical protein AMAG_09276 [Allomyces macrogynus ATCC 38327]
MSSAPKITLPASGIDWAAERVRADQALRELHGMAKTRDAPPKDADLDADGDADVDIAADAVADEPASKGKDKDKDKRKRTVCVATPFPSHGNLVSWKMVREDLYKKPGLPTYARGLFTRATPDGKYEIVVRGYDKFFNLGETAMTRPAFLAQHASGPFHLGVKENGCILFIAAVSATEVVVTSKHSLASMHAAKGAEWLDTHLAAKGLKRADFAAFLYAIKCTAVFELTDDAFEEHVLPYPPEMSGLWLHGLNYNTVEWRGVPVAAVHQVGEAFGLRVVHHETFATWDEASAFWATHRKVAVSGADDRDIEGWVVRCVVDGKDRQFKVKYDQPYLLYREWREVTRAVLKQYKDTVKASKGKRVTNVDFKLRPPRHTLSRQYVAWVKQKVIADPALFEGFEQNQGIFRVRDAFLAESGLASEVGKVQALARGQDKVVLIPVAVQGCGKSTVSAVLHALVPSIAVVQNDALAALPGPKTAGGGWERFHSAILDALAEKQAVFADRNNHTREMRDALVAAIREAYPAARILFVAWKIDHKNQGALLATLVERLYARGDAHATLTPANSDVIPAVKMFLSSHEAVDDDEVTDAHGSEPGVSQDEDAHRAVRVDLDVAATPEQNVWKVLEALRDLDARIVPKAVMARKRVSDAVAAYHAAQDRARRELPAARARLEKAETAAQAALEALRRAEGAAGIRPDSNKKKGKSKNKAPANPTAATPVQLEAVKAAKTAHDAAVAEVEAATKALADLAGPAAFLAKNKRADRLRYYGIALGDPGTMLAESDPIRQKMPRSLKLKNDLLHVTLWFMGEDKKTDKRQQQQQQQQQQQVQEKGKGETAVASAAVASAQVAPLSRPATASTAPSTKSAASAPNRPETAPEVTAADQGQGGGWTTVARPSGKGGRSGKGRNKGKGGASSTTPSVAPVTQQLESMSINSDQQRGRTGQRAGSAGPTKESATAAAAGLNSVAGLLHAKRSGSHQNRGPIGATFIEPVAPASAAAGTKAQGGGSGRGKQGSANKGSDTITAPPSAEAVPTTEPVEKPATVSTPIDAAELKKQYQTLARTATRARVTVDELRYTDRVAAFRVVNVELPDGAQLPPSTDPKRVLHITYALSDKAKAVEANDLLVPGAQKVTTVRLAKPIVLEGRIAGMM